MRPGPPQLRTGRKIGTLAQMPDMSSQAALQSKFQNQDQMQENACAPGLMQKEFDKSSWH
jgi:hypothetical protein